MHIYQSKNKIANRNNKKIYIMYVFLQPQHNGNRKKEKNYKKKLSAHIVKF